MRTVGFIVRITGIMLIWALILALLMVVIVPPFLDRIYYSGPESGHFDGAHFRNPDGDPIPMLSGPSRTGALMRFLPGRGPPRPPWPERVSVHPVDPRTLPPLKAGEMRAIWVGHATVLIQVPGLNILTDPIWNEVAGPYGIGPRRVMAPGIAFDTLPKVDLVVVSHNHYDHLDLPTLKRLWARDRPTIVTGLGNDSVIASAGVPAHGLDWRQALSLPKATVHLTRSHHWSSRWFVDRDRALWSGFVVETGAGNIFFAGDTGPGDMKWPTEAKAWGPIRFAMIPIGAFRFAPHQLVNGAHIGPREAVQVFEKLGAAGAIPIHWGTFHLSNDAWGTPVALLKRFEDCAGVDPTRFRALMPGVPYAVPSIAKPIGPPRAPAAQCREDSPAIRAYP